MRIKKGKIRNHIVIGLLLLLLCGCFGTAGEIPPLETESEIAIAASFTEEDGSALCGGSVRFVFDENSIEHTLGDDGIFTVSGLPRVGDLKLTVLDQQERTQGSMKLSFSEGAVIDATTDDSGIGHISLRRDTNDVALVFILKNDGSLLCALRLTSTGPPHYDELREVN